MIDITISPLLATTSSSNQSRAPPHYTLSSLSAVRPAPPYSLASSSAQRASFPCQPQCKTSPFSETEPETDEELIMADWQVCCLYHTCISKLLTADRTRGNPKQTLPRYVSRLICVSISLKTTYQQRTAEAEKALASKCRKVDRK